MRTRKSPKIRRRSRALDPMMALRGIFFQKGTRGDSKFLALVLVGVLLLHSASGPAHHLAPDPDTANPSEHHLHPTHPVEEATTPSDAARGKDASQPGVGYLAILLALLA